MWINYYRNTLKTVISLYIQGDFNSKEIWVILSNILPFLCDNYLISVSETEIYKQIYDLVLDYNPDTHDVIDVKSNYISDEVFMSKIQIFTKLL